MTPYGAPLHPILIHFPIVLLITAVVLGFVASLPKLHQFRIIELVLLCIGGIAAIIAKEAGEQSEHAFREAIHRSSTSADVFNTHSKLATGVILVFGLITLLRLGTWAWQVWKQRQELLSKKSQPLQLLAGVILHSQTVPLVILIIYLLGGLVGVGLLTATGYYGGELVYTYGVGISAKP
ncbi:MAG: DUF2231 domain-containing protein [Chloroflexota bacterium]|nr:hypothetical protein [Chloroflexota bacterium]